MSIKSENSVFPQKLYDDIFALRPYFDGLFPLQSVRTDFIQHALCGEPPNNSTEEFGSSHQTAFNMRHKVLIALQDLLAQEPVILSGITKFAKTFMPDCNKGPKSLKVQGTRHRHGAKAAKRGISKKYVAVCTNIQHDEALLPRQ